VSARELEATRDELAARVAARRRQLREARAGARAGAPPAEPERGSQAAAEGAAWPELLASGLRLKTAKPIITSPRG
jgi:hypothetical protein